MKDDISASDANSQILSAFPKARHDDVYRALTGLPAPFHLSSTTFRIAIGNEVLVIPYRVYYAVEAISPANLTPIQQVVLNCLLTRHHDGFVRAKHLSRIISCKESWIPPFVIRLLGEYVVEILGTIYADLPSLDPVVYGQFLNENRPFWEITKQRVVSYWDCYYRRIWPRRKDYVGFQIIDHLDSLLHRSA
jgi:hypothetical protein